MEAVSNLDRYFAEMSTHKLLDADERYRVACQARLGDKTAREKMINASLRLVIKRANFYSRQRGWSVDDLIGAGNVGLIKAVDGYNPEKIELNPITGKVAKLKFSTYAVETINGYILDYISSNQPVHVESHSQDKTVKVKKFIDKFYTQYGREPTRDEIKAKFKYKDSALEHIEAQLNLLFVSTNSSRHKQYGTAQWIDAKNISPVFLLEMKQKFASLASAQEQIRNYVDQEASLTQATLFREYYSTLVVIDQKRRPTLAKLSLRLKRKEISVCHAGLYLVDKFARQFEIDRRTVMNLAEIIEEGKIFFEDFYRR